MSNDIIMWVLIILIVWMVLGILIYKRYRSFMKKMAIKELKKQLVNLEFIATHSTDEEEIKRSIEMAGKIWEALKKIEW